MGYRGQRGRDGLFLLSVAFVGVVPFPFVSLSILSVVIRVTRVPRSRQVR